MLLINTRPRDRAAILTQQLQAAQVSVLELPLLELHAVPYSDELLGLYQQLEQAKIIVVVSPTAAQIGMQYLQQAGVALSALTQVHWVAVGKATEQALACYGIHSHVPEVETSEGMLQLAVLKQLAAGSNVAFWRGEGGRQFMMDHLRASSIKVLNFILYRRQCPETTATILTENLALLEMQQRFAVLVTSEASWLNWLALMQDNAELIQHACYLVLGPRLATILGVYQQQHQAGFQFVQIDDLEANTILQKMRLILGNA
ncbi:MULTISPECIES: uroporphyrinogen-III synthase [unclassified Acinetobacter]|uniref:uroporphyrinogen-III synthase n=1 Tax=unclassified Acinetobacter TaxID=196816 RepID=UPI001C241371|nr:MULTISPECIES: uroporphyrinogen-III synthase [unclassified Acinetobacter]